MKPHKQINYIKNKEIILTLLCKLIILVKLINIIIIIINIGRLFFYFF
jgi:hypothetical protein